MTSLLTRSLSTASKSPVEILTLIFLLKSMVYFVKTDELDFYAYQ